jgi:hypothetical protein
MANIFYNRVIRKIVVGFGNLFDNITLVRYNPDLTEAERFVVPIAYADKEDYVMRLEGDYNLDKKVQITLPRMSFQMSGMSYDSSRKQNTNIKAFAKQSGGGVAAQYNPVPYDMDFSLYIYVRNIEDGTQLIEHIIPYFTPDYTIKINLIPEMGIVKEIPVILKNVDMPVDFEGDRERDTRVIIWTLNFTVKGFIFGAVSDNIALIRTSITNILNDISPTDQVVFKMTTPGIGTYQIGEGVYQGYSHSTATATAKVVEFNNNNLTLTNINGNFVSGQPIYSSQSNSNYTFDSYAVVNPKFVEIVTTPNPTNVSPANNYTYTTVITESN